MAGHPVTHFIVSRHTGSYVNYFAFQVGRHFFSEETFTASGRTSYKYQIASIPHFLALLH
jgi:hypothetical protein